jgi:hydrogenase expression/formation protein HypE
MKIGKLDNDLLQRIVLDKIGFKRPEVLTRAGVGEDCAVIDFGEYRCLLSTDPITASASRIGSLAVHISCNDVASNGVAPMALLLTVLLPPEITEAEIEEIMRQASDTAAGLGVEIVGGHTEVTDTVKRPVITSTAIGRSVAPAGAVRVPGGVPECDGGLEGADVGHADVQRNVRVPGEVPECNGGLEGAGVDHADVQRNVRVPGGVPECDGGLEGARGKDAPQVKPGDRILVTKTLALEGTGILASDHGEKLAAVLDSEELSTAKAMLESISVVREGVVAGQIGFSAMHDITEGGILGALWELCRLHGVGAQITCGDLPLHPVSVKICKYFGLNPLRLISSGSMLIIADPERSARICRVLSKESIRVTDIGAVQEADFGLWLQIPEGSTDGSAEVFSRNTAPSERVPIDPPGSDEIYKVQ